MDSRGIVDGTLNALIRSGEAKRLRKKYRTSQEAKEFGDQIAHLRLDPRNLTDSQIAEITGESIFVIRNYIRRLIQEGKVPRRVSHHRHAKTPSNLIE